MKTDVFTDGLDGARLLSLERARRLDKGVRLKASKSITFDSLEEMARMMTEGRRKVVRAVRERPMSLTELAKQLKRDASAVSKDVTAMERAGILKTKPVANPGHGMVKEISAAAQRITLMTSF